MCSHHSDLQLLLEEVYEASPEEVYKMASAKALYEKTMAKMDAFVEAGYGVCYAWEHEHKLALQEGVPLEDILHWHA
jgi:uncharacterized protein YndB with AHSA1/START domain